MASVLGLDIKSVSNFQISTRKQWDHSMNDLLSECIIIRPPIFRYDDDELFLQLFVECFGENQLGATKIQQEAI